MNRGGKLDHDAPDRVLSDFCPDFGARSAPKAKLEGLLKKPPGVIRYPLSFTKDIPELLDRAGELGLEDLIGKRTGSRYEAGKPAGAWVKIKLYQE